MKPFLTLIVPAAVAAGISALTFAPTQAADFGMMSSATPQPGIELVRDHMRHGGWDNGGGNWDNNNGGDEWRYRTTAIIAMAATALSPSPESALALVSRRNTTTSRNTTRRSRIASETNGDASTAAPTSALPPPAAIISPDPKPARLFVLG